jgi:glycosyl transferase family 9 (putative heptosyltransferase)
MGIGDEILAAGQCQRMWDEDPSSRIAVLACDGTPRWHDVWAGNPIIAPPEALEHGEQVRVVMNGPGCRPYIMPPFSKETGWTFNRSFRARDYVARLYLTVEELRRGWRAKERYGPYVLIEPFTKHDNFRWPLERWDDLVAACPDLTFVQHVHKDSPIVLGAKQENANFREACGLLTKADCYVRSESGMCHAAAALGVPQVTLFGGCMDPEVMGYYPKQTVLADAGEGSPCGRWLPCAHCAAAMARITVAEVVTALRARLSWEKD